MMLSTPPPGPELEADLAGEGDVPAPEVIAVDEVAADLLEEPGKQAEVESDDREGRRRAKRQEGAVERGLCCEDDGSVDDLHDDEGEGTEPEDPPRDAESFDNPAAERERDGDLEQGDDGERGDDQRVHMGK